MCPCFDLIKVSPEDLWVSQKNKLINVRKYATLFEVNAHFFLPQDSNTILFFLPLSVHIRLKMLLIAHFYYYFFPNQSTDKRTNVGSCIYTQIFSPKKLFFFHFFVVHFFFIIFQKKGIMQLFRQTLKCFQKKILPPKSEKNNFLGLKI